MSFDSSNYYDFIHLEDKLLFLQFQLVGLQKKLNWHCFVSSPDKNSFIRMRSACLISAQIQFYHDY